MIKPLYLSFGTDPVKLHQKKRVHINGDLDLPAGGCGTMIQDQLICKSVKHCRVRTFDQDLPAVVLGNAGQRRFKGAHHLNPSVIRSVRSQ